jgi:hypothetical protein
MGAVAAVPDPDPGPVPEDGGAPTPPGVPPTREEMRAKVKAALDDGRITINDVLADVFASQYNTEVTVTGMMKAFSSSKLGKRMIGKVEKQFEREGGIDGDQDEG